MFFICGEPTFTNDQGSLPKNLPDCIIAHIYDFGKFILVDEVFLKALQRLGACILTTISLSGKLD